MGKLVGDSEPIKSEELTCHYDRKVYSQDEPERSNMGAYAGAIGSLKRDLAIKKELEEKVRKLSDELSKAETDYMDMVTAQRMLSAVSDSNTEATLKFITGVVNKTLAEIFKSDTRKIVLKKKLFGGAKPHIVVELTNGKGETIDMSMQSGTGLQQVVSGLFIVCLVEIRKGRRLIVFDEKFSGLHKEAKAILSEIFKIFAEGGFQFIFVEYSMNNIGKLYNVEKTGDEAKVYSLDGTEYNDEDVYIFSGQPDLSILDDETIDEATEEGLESEVYI